MLILPWRGRREERERGGRGGEDLTERRNSVNFTFAEHLAAVVNSARMKSFEMLGEGNRELLSRNSTITWHRQWKVLMVPDQPRLHICSQWGSRF